MRSAIILFHCFTYTLALQCVDENNEPVDWYVANKIPRIKTGESLVKQGLAYVYLTSKDYSVWKYSNVSIGSTESIIGKTLDKLYNKNNDLSYILYNNEPPNQKTKPGKGHTKGVVMADEEGGIWLIHSVPYFPMFGPEYTYPKSGTVYGQHFLCISMDLNNTNKVGIQLQYNEPQVYGQHLTSTLNMSLPDLAKAAANVTNKVAPWYNIMTLKSKGGTEFTSFAKSRKFGKELYEDLIAPHLASDLYAETWLNGPGKLMSNCSRQFKVYNIQKISLRAANVTFGTHVDHSKWAVSSTSSNKFYTCIGDINREEHQKVRGGGTVCLNNKILATDYQKNIDSIEECVRENK